jgi:Cu/Ag efflux pump CusA
MARNAKEIAAVLKKVPGAADVRVAQTGGFPPSISLSTGPRLPVTA